MIGRCHDSHGVQRIDFPKRNGGVVVEETVNGDQEDKLQQATSIRRRKESKGEERQSTINSKEKKLYRRQRHLLLVTSFIYSLHSLIFKPLLRINGQQCRSHCFVSSVVCVVNSLVVAIVRD